MKLSIIIPIYQSKEYIRRCINSVLSQSFTDYEMILIDDGSTDGSADVCDEIAGSDNRIIVIHQNNGGLSAARNTGIEIASGNYFTFIDSDDEIAPDTLASNMEILSQDPQIDLIEYPVDIHHGSKHAHILMFEPKMVTGVSVFPDWIKSKGYNHCYAWNKIYRKNLFDTIRFPEGETFEDAAICPSIIEKCNKIYYSNVGMYIYQSNSQGITNHYIFVAQEPLFRHNIKLFYKVYDMGMMKESAKLWILSLNLLIDLCRCNNANRLYLSASMTNMKYSKPSFLRLMIAGSSFYEFIKTLLVSLLGVKTVCEIFSIKKYS